MNNIQNVENIIGYVFNNKNHLIESLTHSSYANEFDARDYEINEFLGDSVLSLIVTNFLIENYSLQVGELSKLRAKIVSSNSLSKITQSFNISDYIRVGNSMLNTTYSKSLYCDLFESILGAIYKDGGYDNCKKFVYKFLIIDKNNIDKILQDNIDYKTLLQELIQAKHTKEKIEYRLIETTGVGKNTVYKVSLYIGDKLINSCQDDSIKKCQQSLSKQAYLSMEKA